MDILKQFKTDEAKEQEGVWFDLDPKTGARIKLARWNNPKFTSYLTRESQKYRQYRRTGTMPDDLADEILVRAMAEHIVLDWEGLTANGEPIPYSKAKARALLGELRDFRDLVADLCQGMEAYRLETVEADEKN